MMQMPEIFRSKIRPIGSSACVIIPQEELNKSKAKIGDIVEIAIFVKKIDHSLRGTITEKVPFKRDKKVREFE